MNIKSISIKNFRCFESNTIDFHEPDGESSGSGLNIFIGENGSGKTSVLEALSYLSQSRLKTKNSLELSDFKDIDKEIEIEGYTSSFKVDHVFGKKKFNCSGLRFQAKTRDRSNSALSNSVVFDNLVIPSKEASPRDYEMRTDVTKPWGTSRLPSVEVVLFDKNRTRHLAQGLFNTKLDDVLADFNFKALTKIKESEKEEPELLDVNQQLKKEYYDDLDDSFLTQVNEDCERFFNYKINLDIFNNLEPFSSGFFSSNLDDKSIHQIPLSKLGSGFETVFSIIFLYHYYLSRDTKLILLIDEPELHLHPRWQSHLIEYLLELSKSIQIFISTHSPLIYKNVLTTNAGLLIFSKSDDEVSIEDARGSSISNLPWSPSWGEINFFAFNLPTIELHNELYGHIQLSTGNTTEKTMEDHLLSLGIPQDRSYTKVDKHSKPQDPYDVTICTYIRNQIHHPENQENPRFDREMLAKSIQHLLDCL